MDQNVVTPLPSTISALLITLALPPRSTVVQPFSLSPCFGFSIFAGRDPLVFMFVFVLGPSLRSGDPVACLECINVGGGDSSLTAFSFLKVAGGEAGPPLTWSLLRFGPPPRPLVQEGRTVWRVAWLA